VLRRLVSSILAALLASVGIIAVAARLGRDWEARVAVTGHSMEPTLFDGDWLLVDAAAYTRRAPEPGELVVTRDPREGGRVLVKRVVGMAGRSLQVGGDHPAHADDPAQIGLVAHGDVIGRPWFRYWPLERFGPV
jgi:nickel-type superoxide dismutase maturation protease